MKNFLAIASFAAMAGSLYLGYRQTSAFWQATLINAGTSFMSIGIGILVINVYLERKSRRGAVRSLFVLSTSAVVNFHNSFLDLVWAEFGRSGWRSIWKEYVAAGGKPEALSQASREKIYRIYKNNPLLADSVEQIEESFTELSRLVGWDLDADLLKRCLDSRLAISRLRKVVLDDSNTAKGEITEHLLDTDAQTQAVRSKLMEIAEISDLEPNR